MKEVVCVKKGTRVTVLVNEESDYRKRVWKKGKIIDINLENIDEKQVPSKENIKYTVKTNENKNLICTEEQFVPWSRENIKEQKIQFEINAKTRKWEIIQRKEIKHRNKGRVNITQDQQKVLQEKVDAAIANSNNFHDGALYSAVVLCAEPNKKYKYNKNTFIIYPRNKMNDGYLYEIVLTDWEKEVSYKISGIYNEEEVVIKIKNLLEKNPVDSERQINIKNVSGIVAVFTLIAGAVAYVSRVSLQKEYIQVYKLPDCTYDNIGYLADIWNLVFIVGLVLSAWFVVCFAMALTTGGAAKKEIPCEWKCEIKTNVFCSMWREHMMREYILCGIAVIGLLAIMNITKYNEEFNTCKVIVCEYMEKEMAVVGTAGGMYYLEELEETDKGAIIYNDYYIVVNPSAIAGELQFHEKEYDSSVKVKSRSEFLH